MNVTDKLSSAVMTDRAGAVETVLRVLKSDFFALLSEYADVDPQSVEIAADVADGGVRFTATASVTQIKPVGKILP